MYRYIYMIVCTEGSWKWKYYIGQRTSKLKPEEDVKYKGSGVLIKKYYKKYPHSYIKSIICTCNSQKELDEAEKKAISMCLGHEDCLNIAKGGINYVGINCCYKMTQEEYKQHCNNISLSLKGHKGANPFCHMTEEQIQQWKKENSIRQKGRKKSQESINKQKKAMKNRYNCYKFLSDGYNVVFVAPEHWGEYLDDGYIFSKKKYKLNT